MSSDDDEDLQRLVGNAALGAAIWAFASVAVGAIGSAASTTDGVVWYGLAFVAGVFAIIGFLAGVGAVGNAWKVATLAWRHSERWRTVLATGLVVLGVVVPHTGIVSFVGGGAIGAAAWMYSPLPDANYVRGGAIRPGAGYWGFSEPGEEEVVEA